MLLIYEKYSTVAYNMMKSSNDFGFVLGGSIWPFANPLDLVDLPVWKSIT